ncbi:MAG: FAD-dependent oxidoreductase [Spirochaetes bacterium RBG_16_49_21]|nr:MAG: FAD-dependent oxidoreductase [Spirochaetes bacterium RBG_16_49_21]
MKETDFLIIGAGIIGLTLAHELKKKFPLKKIIILEKESDVALHGSGRNSGVLHAGFYYTANSMKARFTRDGNSEMVAYCEKKGLAVNKCRKVVVATSEEELPPLFELERRGIANGVQIKIIDEKELAEIDPNAKTYKHALYSPTTSTVDPVEICNSLKKELIDQDIEFYFNCPYLNNLKSNAIRTGHGVFEANKIINAAGLYADKIGRDFGFCMNYVIVPFKGIYLKFKGGKPVSTNIYPVPDLKNPFLGVHFTITVDGTVKIGPTAIPAFWRENYQGLTNFKFGEFIQIILKEADLFLRNAFGFRRLALQEMKKYNKKYLVGLAARLVKSLDPTGFQEWSRPGIRAQLLNYKTRELVQDFIVEGDSQSVHVLNAVSPAFTGSFPFSRWVVRNYIEKVI